MAATERPIGSPSSSGSESPEGVTRMEIERLDVASDAASDANPVEMKESSSLRRSNSAPMFNGPNMGDDSPVFQPIHDRPRVRRFSTHVTGSPKTPSSSKGRVTQIKHEESMDIVSRETEGEREVQSAFQMSQSWDDMHLDASIKSLRDGRSPQHASNKARFSDPLSIMPPVFPLSSSPSPTRAAGKQCFSPSTQAYRNNSMSPIPSPTRSSVTRRSMSPVLRPSNLGIGVKRKACDHDMEVISSKRIFLSSPSHPSSTASISSVSSDESSPLQQRNTSTENNSSIHSNTMLPSPSQFQFSSPGSNSV